MLLTQSLLALYLHVSPARIRVDQFRVLGRFCRRDERDQCLARLLGSLRRPDQLDHHIQVVQRPLEPLAELGLAPRQAGRATVAGTEPTSQASLNTSNA